MLATFLLKMLSERSGRRQTAGAYRFPEKARGRTARSDQAEEGFLKAHGFYAKGESFLDGLGVLGPPRKEIFPELPPPRPNVILVVLGAREDRIGEIGKLDGFSRDALSIPFQDENKEQNKNSSRETPEKPFVQGHFIYILTQFYERNKDSLINKKIRKKNYNPK